MESSLIDDLGADSLDLIDLVMSIEDEYDVGSRDMIESIKTIGDVVKFIEENK